MGIMPRKRDAARHAERDDLRLYEADRNRERERREREKERERGRNGERERGNFNAEERSGARLINIIGITFAHNRRDAATRKSLSSLSPSFSTTHRGYGGGLKNFFKQFAID